MKKIFFKLSIMMLFLIFLLEISSIILIRLKLLPNGISTSTTLVPDKNYGFWHHKNRTFNLASPCWSSKVSYNNFGMRSAKDFKLKSNKKRIAILGDSMSENIEVSDGEDFGSLLQHKNPNYEVLNFSVRSTGLGDQIELFNGFVKKFEPNVIFLFLSDNDLEDNYYLNKRKSQIKYKINQDTVERIPINKNFFSKQDSLKHKIKNKHLIFIKEKSKTYILYSRLKAHIRYLKYKINNADDLNLKKNDDYIDYEQKKIVYKYLVNKFKKSLDENQSLYVFVNPRPKILSEKFYPEKKNIEVMKKIWGDSVIDPTINAIKFLKSENRYKSPFLSFSCDGHFSKYGANYMATFVTDYFSNNQKNSF